jgi:hypothetical protein
MIETFGERKPDETEELAYRKWVHDNPGGYVVNWDRSHNDNMTLHRASCGWISDPHRGPFTTARLYKICCAGRDELVEWMEAQRLSPRWRRRMHSGTAGCHP